MQRSIGNDESELEIATEVVLAFAERMNDWENRMHYRSRFERGKIVAEANRQWIGDKSVEELMREYYDIIAKCCTARERSYGGHPYSWAKGGKYNGIGKETVIDRKQVQPTRIEVIARGGLFPNQQYKFVLFKKKGNWLIDNVYSRNGDGSNWERAYF